MPRTPRTAELDSDLRSFLRARLLRTAPYLAHLADDLVQETLADLTAFLATRESPLRPDEQRAVAGTILRRRIADHHRGAMRRMVDSLSTDDIPEIASEENLEHRTAVRQVLWLVLKFLATLDEKDSALLLREELAEADPQALSVADRKRLSRLRARLRQHLSDTLHGEAHDLLKE